MEIPLVKNAPVVISYARNFRRVFSNEAQYEHFKNYVSGLILLENKTLASMARSIVNNTDETNISRFLKNTSWSGEELNKQRIEFLLEKTIKEIQLGKGYLIIDDTLCEHVGSLFEYIARYYNHTSKTFSLAHNPVTSHYVNGKMRFPVDFRNYRQYDEFTKWETFVKEYFPTLEIPTDSNSRNKLKRKIEPKLLEDSEFKVLHESFKTKITLACELVVSAIEYSIDFSIVLFDSWYLAPELIETLEKYKKDWISVLKPNRKIRTDSFSLFDASGKKIEFGHEYIKLEELVPLIPKSAFKSITIEDKTYWVFSKTVVIDTLGRCRILITFENEDLTGNYVTLVTNRTDWEGNKIISSYTCRWPIETFYRDSKQNLGLEDYQFRDGHAIQKHWYLVFLAYSFLLLNLLHSSLVDKLAHQIKTIGEATRHQAQEVVRDFLIFVHRQLSKRKNPQKLFDLLWT